MVVSDADQVAQSLLRLRRRLRPFQLVVKPSVTPFRDFYAKNWRSICEDAGIDVKEDFGAVQKAVSSKFEALSDAERKVDSFIPSFFCCC